MKRVLEALPTQLIGVSKVYAMKLDAEIVLKGSYWARSRPSQR